MDPARIAFIMASLRFAAADGRFPRGGPHDFYLVPSNWNPRKRLGSLAGRVGGRAPNGAGAEVELVPISTRGDREQAGPDRRTLPAATEFLPKSWNELCWPTRSTWRFTA